MMKLEDVKNELTRIAKDPNSQVKDPKTGGKKLMDIRKVNYVILGGDNAGEHLLM